MVESRCAIAITVLPAISVVEALLDRGLHFAVERGRRLVEHQDRRVLQDHARDRDALTLPARELHAALADLRVISAPAFPVLEVEDELLRMRELRRTLDLRVGRARASVADVVADRTVQQRGVLRHHRDLRAQALLRDVRDVLPVDQDASALEIEEAQQQVDQRRLAGARAADQPDLLAGLHRSASGRRSPGNASRVPRHRHEARAHSRTAHRQTRSRRA